MTIDNQNSRKTKKLKRPYHTAKDALVGLEIKAKGTADGKMVLAHPQSKAGQHRYPDLGGY